MTRTPIDFMRDAVEAMEAARAFIEGIEYPTFAEDEKTNFAVIWALEISRRGSEKRPPKRSVALSAGALARNGGSERYPNSRVLRSESRSRVEDHY